MNRTLKRIAVVFSGLCIFSALAVPPGALVDHFLPPAYQQYHRQMVWGLWLLKVMLAINGILYLALPRVLDKLFAVKSGASTIPFVRPSLAEWCGLAAVTSLATIIRCWNIGMGFTIDEHTIAETGIEKPFLHFLMRTEQYRAFYTLLARISYSLLGKSEVAARMPALIAGIASVPALYFLVRRWLNPGAALASALVLALSTFHSWYSQCATAYSLAFLFILLSLWFLEEALADDSLGSWLKWTACVFLAVLSHMEVAGVVLAGQALYLAWQVLRGRAPAGQLFRFLTCAVYAVMACAIVFAPPFFMYSTMLAGLITSSGQHWVETMPRGTVSGQLFVLGQWLVGAYAPWPLQIACIGLAILGLMILIRRHANLVAYLLTPTLLYWALFSTGLIRVTTQRYSMFTLIPLIVFLGVALSAPICWLQSVLQRRVLALAGIVGCAVVWALFAVTACWSLSVYLQSDRTTIRTAIEFVRAHKVPGEVAWFDGWAYDEFKYYYPELQRVETAEGLRLLLEQDNEIWLIYFEEHYLERLPLDVKDELLRRTDLVQEFQGLPEQDPDPALTVVRHLPRKGNVKK